MRILFDQGTPRPLRRYLKNHVVALPIEMGWSELENGDLLDRAEQEGYELLITTDQNLKYQQNLSLRRISIIVLLSANWNRINAIAEDIASIVDTVQPGAYLEIAI